MTCKKCGQCCRWSYFGFSIPVELSPLLKLRGAEIVDSHVLRVPLVCSKLDQTTNLCTDYDNRPDVCKEFPEVGGIRPKECKYDV